MKKTRNNSTLSNFHCYISPVKNSKQVIFLSEKKKNSGYRLDTNLAKNYFLLFLQGLLMVVERNIFFKSIL